MPGVDVDRFFHGAAPELVDPQRFRLTDTGATPASDVYAFGVLTWEVSGVHANFSGYILRAALGQIFAGQVPFSEKGTVAGVYSMLKGRRPDRPHHPELSDRVWKVIQRCWKDNPTQRKTMAQVVTILEAEVSPSPQKTIWSRK